MNKEYSLYISLPKKDEAGDATICTFSGKYRTFFWGVDNSSKTQKALKLLTWHQVLESQGIEISPEDRELIYNAVINNKMRDATK